jgi:hypothetical protein
MPTLHKHNYMFNLVLLNPVDSEFVTIKVRSRAAALLILFK